MSFTAGATLLNTATADADGVSHAGDDIITTGSGADTIGGEVASSGSAAATNRAGTTAGTGAAHAGNDTIDAGDGTNWVSGGAFGNADATMTNEADVSRSEEHTSELPSLMRNS